MSTETIQTHDVFISHSSKDKSWADAVCAVLEQHRIRCWIAPRDITPGAEWGAAIIQGLAASRMMVLIFSSEANASAQVRREVERAISRGQIVLPVRIENIPPQGAMEYALGNTHWLDAFSPPMEKQLDLLAQSVKTLLQMQAVATPVAVQSASSSSPAAATANAPARAPAATHPQTTPSSPVSGPAAANAALPSPMSAGRSAGSADRSTSRKSRTWLWAAVALLFLVPAGFVLVTGGSDPVRPDPVDPGGTQGRGIVQPPVRIGTDEPSPEPGGGETVATNPQPEAADPRTTPDTPASTKEGGATKGEGETIDVLALVKSNRKSKQKTRPSSDGPKKVNKTSSDGTKKRQAFWEFRDGVFYSQKDQPGALLLPIQPPSQYRLEIWAAHFRPGGLSGLAIGLECGENRCVVLLDAFDGMLSGISCIDGKRAGDNDTKYTERVFMRGLPVKIVVTVRKGSIHVTADDKTIINWAGNSERLTLDPMSPLKYPGPFAIYSFGGSYSVSRVTLTTLAE